MSYSLMVTTAEVWPDKYGPRSLEIHWVEASSPAASTSQMRRPFTSSCLKWRRSLPVSAVVGSVSRTWKAMLAELMGDVDVTDCVMR